MSPSVAIGLALSSLPQTTEFTALFDRFRIIDITCQLTLRTGNMRDTQDALSAAGPSLPTLYVTRDIDSMGQITALQMLQTENMQVYNFGDQASNTITFKIPCYVKNQMNGLDGNPAATSLHPVRSPWLDAAQTNSIHGVVKVACSGTDSAVYNFDSVISATFECAGTR